MSQRKMSLRVTMMVLGVLLVGIAVACFRLASFGVDPCSCMNLGISGLIGMSFGTWQLIMNAVLLVVVFFTVRKCIGLGTVVNMVGVGYMADFICYLVQDKMQLDVSLPIRIALLVIGMALVAFGAALYMSADLGIAPYDSISYIITKYSHDKIPFRYARILSDVTAVLIGLGFGIAANLSLGSLVGIGTIINAFGMGPLIQFFRKKLDSGKKHNGRSHKNHKENGKQESLAA